LEKGEPGGGENGEKKNEKKSGDSLGERGGRGSFETTKEGKKDPKKKQGLGPFPGGPLSNEKAKRRKKGGGINLDGSVIKSGRWRTRKREKRKQILSWGFG